MLLSFQPQTLPPSPMQNSTPKTTCRLGKSLLNGTLWIMATQASDFHWLQFKSGRILQKGKSIPFPLSPLEGVIQSLKKFMDLRELPIPCSWDKDNKSEKEKDSKSWSQRTSLQAFFISESGKPLVPPTSHDISSQPPNPSLVFQDLLQHPAFIFKNIFSLVPAELLEDKKINNFLGSKTKVFFPSWIGGILLVLLMGFLLTT